MYVVCGKSVNLTRRNRIWVLAGEPHVGVSWRVENSLLVCAWRASFISVHRSARV